MKVLGLITEYNPFHNGHVYHIEQSKLVSGADYVVCVMSGNFIQRGEPAIVNKWERARMALHSGADLIVELPLMYAVSSAEQFAFGGISILNSMGIVDSICFGSESGSMDELQYLASILFEEPPEFKVLLKKALSTGMSFAAARETALSGYLSNRLSNVAVSSLLNSSNNILGLEYLKALKKLESSILPYTVKRTGNSYNCEVPTGSISSATAIRRLLTQGSEQDNVYKLAVPEITYNIIKKEIENGRGPVTPQCFEGIIISRLRSMSKEEIAQLPYVLEGLEGRIKTAADEAGSYDSLIDLIVTKRYPRTRINRIMTSVLTGISREDHDIFNKHGGPQYIRVLGFNGKGRELLQAMKKKASLPIIIKAADFKESCNPLLSKMIRHESFSTDMFVLGYGNPLYRKGGQEFTSNVIII